MVVEAYIESSPPRETSHLEQILCKGVGEYFFPPNTGDFC